MSGSTDSATGERPPATGCGVPSVWSAGGRTTVLSCIGCGRIDTAQQCAGTCGEYGLELAGAAAHDAAVARLDGARERADTLAELIARLATDDRADDGFEIAYRELQSQAREVLRALPPAGVGDDEPAERLVVFRAAAAGASRRRRSAWASAPTSRSRSCARRSTTRCARG